MSEIADHPAGVRPPQRPGFLVRIRRMVVALGILAVIALITGSTGMIESVTFYFPSRQPFATERGVEDVSIATPDGKTLHGWFIRARGARPGEVRPAVLHCHGNAGNISSHVDFSRFLTDRGVHVLIFDYRGYGRSSPARGIRREHLVVDALAAFDALAARPDVDPARIGIYGVSLGGAPALAVATQRPARSVCSVSAFTSFPSVASDHVPILARLLIMPGRAPIDDVARLGSRPYLIVHGERDSIVRPRHARELHAAANAGGVPVSLAMIRQADHNDIAEYEQMRTEVGDFFARTLAPNP